MKIQVIDRLEDIIVNSDLPESVFYENNPFVITSPDYMLEITKHSDYIFEVTNACDGWGDNCRELFTGASVQIFK